MTERIPKPLRAIAHAVLPRRARRWIFRRWFRPKRPHDDGFSWVPPKCPPGMVVGAPDFIGIGVGKSGTTWWHWLIRQHSGVHDHPGVNKERQYLRYRLLDRSPGPEHRDAYAAWFPRPPGMIVGEWTAWYLGHAWLGQALQVVAPEAKLLVILRDPVERYISAMSNESVIRPGAEVFHFNQGLYSFWLGALAPYIDSAKLLVLQYERCVKDPEAELARTQQFLGLDVQMPAQLREPRNPTLEPKLALDADRRQTLVRAYVHDVTDLVDRHPEIDRSLWPNFT